MSVLKKKHRNNQLSPSIPTSRKALPKGWCFLCFYLIAVSWGLTGQEVSDEGSVKAINRTLANYYAEQAVELLRRNDIESSRTLAEAGVEFDGTNSDLLHVLGVTSHQPVKDRIELFEDAIIYSRYHHVLPRESREELIGLYATTKNFDRAFYHLEALTQQEILESSESTATALELILKAGRRADFQSFIRQAQGRYPNSLKIRGLLFPDHIPPRLKEEQFLSLTSTEQKDYLWYLRRFIERLDAGQTREEWIRFYWQSGGRDNGGLVALYLQDVRGNNPRILAALEEHFFSQEIIDREVITTVLDTVSDEQVLNRLRAYLLEMFGNGTRPMVYDSDGDNQYDQYYWYDQEALKRWEYDEDQDGYMDRVIQFDSRLPVLVRVNHPGAHHEFIFSGYPYLDRVHFRSGASREETWILPGLTLPWRAVDSSLDLTRFQGFPGSYMHTLVMGDTSAESIVPVAENLAYQRVQRSADFLRIEFLSEGEITGVAEDHHRNGYFEIQRFDKPQGLSGIDQVIMIDTEEDGRFEIMRLEPGGLEIYQPEPRGELEVFIPAGPSPPLQRYPMILESIKTSEFHYYQIQAALRSSRDEN